MPRRPLSEVRERQEQRLREPHDLQGFAAICNLPKEGRTGGAQLHDAARRSLVSRRCSSLVQVEVEVGLGGVCESKREADAEHEGAADSQRA